MRGILQKLAIITIIWFVSACSGGSPDLGLGSGAGVRDNPSVADKSVGAGLGNNPSAADGTLGSKPAAGEIVPGFHRDHSLLLEGESYKGGYSDMNIRKHALIGEPAFTTAEVTKFLAQADPNGNRQVSCSECQDQMLRVIECAPRTDEEIKQVVPPDYLKSLTIENAFRIYLKATPEQLCRVPHYRDFPIGVLDEKAHLDQLSTQTNSTYLFFLMPKTPEAAKYGELSPTLIEFDSREQFLANLENSDMLRTVRVVPYTIPIQHLTPPSP